MLDVDQRVQKDRPSSLAQWAYQVIGQPGVSLRVRLRGNNLHVLCESSQALEAKTIVERFSKALKMQEGGNSLPTDPENPIYQIIVYGRAVGQERPDWIKQILIQPSPNPDAKDSQDLAGASFEAATTDPAFMISNESLARSGSPEAIARYLSETISSLGVSVKVLIQNLKEGEGESERTREDTGKQGHGETETFSRTPSSSSQAQTALNRRLWVVCHSNYSPDPSLLAEPIVQQLRSLQLKGFRDAAICSQVSGEASPEWMLRVDLTPPQAMLKEWAVWGDVQAIARMLNQALAKQGMEVRAVLKDVTLHLFCSVLTGKQAAAPEKPRAVGAIVPLLKALAPQGIHAATIYGVESHQRSLVPEQETPAWIEWRNLPAADNPVRRESAYALGQQGNLDALTFLLQRLINPDLDRRLATGGIHLKIRRKQDLLHIMSEAPICPPQAQVGSPIARFLRQLAIPGIAGVRIYGRRAGATSPSWNYGIDFVHRRRLVPEATPEFAASDVYVDELVAPTGEPVLRRELQKEDLKNGLEQTIQATVGTIQRWLCYSQLFVPIEESQELATVPRAPQSKRFSVSPGARVAMVWGAVGLLLALQADWLMGRLVRSQSTVHRAAVTQESPAPISLPQLSLKKGSTKETNNFKSSGFTKPGEKSIIVNRTDNSLTPEKSRAASAAILAAARSPNPSFNNRLLDEKLALYQQRLLQGNPPDVIILGSSRALRGVDPIALQDALADQGYSDVEVFNFGINGATAQVVDLILRRILTPEQLPKLIIWADGARAFNSGREDITYQAIASSDGYQQLQAGTFPNLTDAKKRDNVSPAGRNSALQRSAARGTGETTASNLLVQPLTALNTSYQSLSDRLNQSLANLSATYPKRDQLKSLLREQFVTLLKQTNFPQAQTSKNPKESLTAGESIDFDGFLPVSVRFSPATYYKQHPRVAGDYDGDYEGFQLGGEQDSALESLLQFAQAHKIDIVFVNLPLTKDYLDPVRSEYEEKFQRYMRSSALERGLIFRDLTQLLLTKADYFSDPSHLNRYGAYKVSNHLAQDPMIPWPDKGTRK